LSRKHSTLCCYETYTIHFVYFIILQKIIFLETLNIQRLFILSLFYWWKNIIVGFGRIWSHMYKIANKVVSFCCNCLNCKNTDIIVWSMTSIFEFQMLSYLKNTKYLCEFNLQIKSNFIFTYFIFICIICVTLLGLKYLLSAVVNCVCNI